MNGSVIRIFLRSGCHLCDEAMEAIEASLGSDVVSSVERVDIESSDALLRKYLERIPVVEVDGVEVSELEFDREAFRRALDRTPGTSGQVA